MATSRKLAEAEAEVARLRQSVDGVSDAGRSALAQALLAVSRAQEASDRLDEALRTAREAVDTLAPSFLQAPSRDLAAMQAVVAQYVGLAPRCGQRPDAALLAPIAAAMGQAMTAEDDAG